MRNKAIRMTHVCHSYISIFIYIYLCNIWKYTCMTSGLLAPRIVRTASSWNSAKLTLSCCMCVRNCVITCYLAIFCKVTCHYNVRFTCIHSHATASRALSLGDTQHWCSPVTFPLSSGSALTTCMYVCIYVLKCMYVCMYIGICV